MTLERYCHEQGMTLAQYEEVKTRLDQIADVCIEKVKLLHNWNMGMYYSVSELFEELDNEVFNCYLIQAFKERLVEFADNLTAYRL